jgi:hypothetical protein
MGLLSGLLGNASEVAADQLDDVFESVLVEGERIEKAFKLIRDIFVFTNRRVIFLDKQGVTGKKMEFVSIPYSKVTKFSMETAGHFDIDSELKIWVGSEPMPVTADFGRSVAIREAYAVLGRHVLT